MAQAQPTVDNMYQLCRERLH